MTRRHIWSGYLCIKNLGLLHCYFYFFTLNKKALHFYRYLILKRKFCGYDGTQTLPCALLLHSVI